MNNFSRLKSFFRISLALAVASLLWSCGQLASFSVPQKIENFSGSLVDGTSVHYAELKGDATLIVLTASWCPACRVELPILQNISADFYNRGLRIIVISEDDTPEIAANFKKQAEIPWPTIHWNYELMNLLGNPSVIPVSYLVDKQDSIRNVTEGVIDEQKIRSLLNGLLK